MVSHLNAEAEMGDGFDFERYWLDKFTGCLGAAADEAVRKEILQGSDGLTDQTNRWEVIAWSRSAMERLEAALERDRAEQVMTGCACQYPKEDLQDLRAIYEQTGDIEQVHGLLQDRFERLLRETLDLEDRWVGEILSNGWGLAGIRDGNSIIATKIPKSGYLVEYMHEINPDVKRQYYCHCPRVRSALALGESLPGLYCYCGAGYYQGIWETITGKPVQVEVLESVLQGGDVCKVMIRLP